MSVFYSQYGWDVIITIGAMTLTTNREHYNNGLCDTMAVTTTEGVSRDALFSFVPPTGIIDLMYYQGKQVSIFARCNGPWEQIFFGYVDTPSYDMYARKIIVKCTDQRANRTTKLPLSVVQAVGTYSTSVFGLPRDNGDELEKRLETVAASFDFDRFGNPQVTPWAAKATPDYTLTSANIQQASQVYVTNINTDKSINVVNIQVSYTYQRLHQQACRFNWTGYDDFIQDWYNVGRPNFPSRDTIKSAAENSDWKTVSDGISFTSLWPAQYFPSGGGFISWAPDDVHEEYKGVETIVGYLLDSTGNYVTAGTPPKLVPKFEPVLDANGKQVMQLIRRTVTDTSSHLCKGALWTSALRFAQSVTEQYNIQLKAPQAISTNTSIPKNENIAINDQFDITTWEKSDVISFTDENFYINKKINYSDAYNAIQVALNRARHDILGQNRNVEVGFISENRTLWPHIDLTHTVELDVDLSAVNRNNAVRARGKVYSINHSFNFKTRECQTEVKLRLTRTTGSASNSSWSVAVPIENPSYIGDTKNITLETHIGKDPVNTRGSEKWTGWLCNGTLTSPEQTTYRSNFLERFIVDFPKIPDALRDELVYSSNNTFDISLPNDYLETEA